MVFRIITKEGKTKWIDIHTKTIYYKGKEAYLSAFLDVTEKKEADKEPRWKISLAFNFENLGPIFIEASIEPPKISSKIWAENNQTQQLILRAQGQFTKQLEALGFTVEDIQCIHGQATKAKTALTRGLVDIKA